MFGYFRNHAIRQSDGLRALLVFLALSFGFQICAPAFASVSDYSPPGVSILSNANQPLDSNMLDSNDEHLECCVFAALHSDRGQISPLAVAVDASYLSPVSPPTVVLAETTPAGRVRVEFEPASDLEIALGPVYLATRRLRI